MRSLPEHPATISPGRARAELMALQRLAQARQVLDAILVGHVDADPDTVAALRRLVARAEAELRWARREAA